MQLVAAHHVLPQRTNTKRKAEATDTYVQPFYSSTSATDFANYFAASSALRVRYKPGEPGKSFVRREDQVPQMTRLSPHATEL
jgi:hypothetical protein